jgi:hypothetical protein
MTFLTKNFGQKNPIWFFNLHVQLDQNAILNKLIWTRSFQLGLFGWFSLLGLFTKFFLPKGRDNNIIWAATKYIYNLNFI